MIIFGIKSILLLHNLKMQSVITYAKLTCLKLCTSFSKFLGL